MSVYILSSIKGLGMLAVGLVALQFGFARGTTWNTIFWGWLAYILSVSLKIIWARLTNESILNFLEEKSPSGFSDFASWTYIGFLTGIFECGLVWVFILYTPALDNITWTNALGFGIAYGTLESILMGLFSLVNTVYYSFWPEKVSEEKYQEWKTENTINKNNIIGIPVPIVERISTVFIHLFSSMLILFAIKGSNYILFLYAFIFKSIVDGLAGWMHLEKNIKDITDNIKLWKFESIFVILGLISYIGIIVLK